MAEDLKDISTRGALVAIAVATIVIAVVATLTAVGPQIGNHLPKKDKYQAVFLTTREVYFGKLGSTGGKFVTLRDVYSVQSGGQNGASPAPSASPNLSLVANDQNPLTKPDRDITIATDQIVFWENMSDDSAIVKKIKENTKD